MQIFALLPQQDAMNGHKINLPTVTNHSFQDQASAAVSRMTVNSAMSEDGFHEVPEPSVDSACSRNNTMDS